MFFPSPKAVISSAIFRIVIRCLLGFILVVTLVGAIAGLVGREHARIAAHEEAHVLTQAALSTFEDRGLGAVVAIVDESGDEPEEDESFQSLRSTSDGALLAGVDAPMVSTREPFLFVPNGWDDDDAAQMFPVAIGETALLTVGVSLEGVYDIEELMVTGAVALILVGLPLTLVTGFILSALVLGRLRQLEFGAQRIGDGHLDYRIQTSEKADEFDRLGQSLNQMAQSLQTSYRNIQDVSIGVAHNLRTPLTRLRQRVYEAMDLAERANLDSAALAAADAEADELVAMFDALLRIGEIEAGQRRAAFKEVSLSNLAAEAVESFDPVAEDAGGSVRAEISQGCSIQGDEDLIRQLLVNLIENAIEHGGGKVIVRVEPTQEGCLLQIDDNGLGIPSEDRNRVFDRFYQTSDGKIRSGFGLGLSIVKSIVDLHGGEITAEARNSGGASFQIILT